MHLFGSHYKTQKRQHHRYIQHQANHSLRPVTSDTSSMRSHISVLAYKLALAAPLTIAGLLTSFSSTAFAQTPEAPSQTTSEQQPALQTQLSDEQNMSSDLNAPAGEMQPTLPENATDVPASEVRSTATTATQSLSGVQDGMRVTQERIVEIRAQIATLEGNTALLSAELVAAGKRIDLAGQDIHSIEERIEELLGEERELRQKLDGHDSSISNLLASLQRITANPPPAIIVDPNDALASARAAMLLSSVLPQMQLKAATVTTDLENLNNLKQVALDEASVLNANVVALNEERLRIATIIEARKAGLEWLSEDLLLQESEAQALADRATSLEQLLNGLENRLGALSAADRATQSANAGQPVTVLDMDTLDLAFADTTRTQPAVPIEAARGYLQLPVAAPIMRNYGSNDGFGGLNHGQSFQTPENSPVNAPSDGWVVFEGEFLNYGHIVIINAGQNYRFVLAGLEETSVSRGQFVQMGTQLGSMGGKIPTPRSSATQMNPILYVELREGGIAIDPADWWTKQSEQEETDQANG